VRWGRELGLALVVAAAGTALYFSVRHDVKGIEVQEQALFPGFDPTRVRCIIAENVPRDWRMRVERDERGAWKLVDPIAVPANVWRIDHLLTCALGARGREVPASERDPVQLGFAPPRAVLEIEELVDGKSHHERVELGGLDADGRSVNVRVRGRFLRVLRDLDTALDVQLGEYKTNLALEFTIADVVRVRRSGTLLREGASAPVDVGLEIELTDEGWRSLKPEGLELDSTFILTWLQGLASIQHTGTFDEVGGPLDSVGLAQPEMEIELEMRDGTKQALILGRPGHAEGQVWYALRKNLGFVWGLEQYRVWLIGYALEAMIDSHLLRTRREDVLSIALQGQDGGELRFTPEGRIWHLARRRPGEKAFDKAVLADPAKVGDLLGLFEKAELTEFSIGQALPEMPEAPAVWVAVGGVMQGGWFGEAVKGPGGVEYRRFQRRGENASSLVPTEIYDAVNRPIDEFWSMQLAQIAEHGQETLSITGLGKDLHYAHNSTGKWARMGTDDEAKELHAVLDALCFLRAERYLPPRVDPDWDEPVTVEFTDAFAKKQTIELGRAREGDRKVEVIYDKLRAVAKDQDLHARLLKILRAP